MPETHPILLRLVLASASALIMTTAGIGCGDGKPYVDSSLAEATVSGIIKVQGKPADGGEIRFNPSNSGRIVATKSAPIGPDGKYTIKTYTGGNQITFDGDVAKNNRGVGLVRKYAEVKPGENHADFDLMSDAEGKDAKITFPIKGMGKGANTR